MKKIPVLIALMVIFALMGSVAYYFDENDEKEKAFAFALWMLIPFGIIVEVGFSPIRSLVQWVKSKIK
jgi:hypothetical protein